MKYILTVLVSISVLALSVAVSPCMTNKHTFKLMDYHNGHFYTAGSKCVCKYSMSLEKEWCDGDPNGTKIKYDSVLLVDKDNDTLLTCGTGRTFSCQVKDLQTLESLFSCKKSEKDDIMNSTVVAGGKGRKVVAFISWGERGGTNETVLYTATKTYNDTKLSPLSVRKLRGGHILQLYNQNGTGSRIELVEDENITRSYLESFDPVGGFAYDGKVYFLANQLNDSQSLNIQPKLIRLCQDDQGTNQWLSYKDIAITCQQSERVLQANLMPLGRNVRSLNNDSHVMAALFYTNSSIFNYSLCLYTFDSIRAAFDGDNAQVMDNRKRYLKPVDPACKHPTPSCNKRPEFRNGILDGQITGESIWTFESKDQPLMTPGIIISGMFTVILISKDSHVNVHYLKGISTPSLVLFRVIPVQKKPKVMKIMDDEVYILIDSGVIKKSLYNSSNCESYISAHSCIRQEDPFCGWCPAEASCTMLRECKEEETWLPITTVPDTLRQFSINSVEPTRGPISGGTSITIIGENFDLFRKIEISIGNKPCTTNTESIRNETTFTCLTPSSPQPDVLNISYTLSGDAGPNHIIHTFEYLEDPTISNISPNRSFESGGRTLTVFGTNFDIIQNLSLHIVGENISEGCDHTSNKSIITCTAPEATEELKKKLEEEKGEGTNVTEGKCGSVDILCVDVEFQMDRVSLRRTLEMVKDPFFYNFTEEGLTKQYSTNSRSIVIKGDRINISASAADFDVTIGDQICDVLPRKVYRYEFHCLPPAEQPKPLKSDSKDPEVWLQTASNRSVTSLIYSLPSEGVRVRLGYIERHVGFLHYVPPEEEHYVYLYTLVGVLCVIVLALVLMGVLLRRRSRRTVKKLQNDMQVMEMRMKAEFRQAFAELQTDMTDITGELVETGLPFHTFPVYAFQILFPAHDVTTMASHQIFNYPETTQDVTDVDTAMMKLNELFHNKFFVLSVINTLEQRTLCMSEKSSFASYLGAALINDLCFFSQLVKELLKQYVADAVLKKKQKTLFRRYESITEKLAGIWMSLCLYQHFLKHRGGSALIMLVKAIQTVMTKSPIDDVTDAARATLSYEQLLLCQVDNDSVIHVRVTINGGEFECACAVLGCDTINQVKAKCIGEMYKKDAASTRPTVTDVNLLWHTGKQGRLILEEHDTRPSDENCVKLMTLADYHVTDGALMELLNKHALDEESEYVNYREDNSAMSGSKVNLLVDDEDVLEKTKESDSNHVTYHLTKPGEGQEQQKATMLPEAHLHKLLQTKLNVKQYVDEALDSALDRKDIPAVVKFIFSVLDELAADLGVDNETLLAWKNNCYLIRFWGMLMSKPQIVLDVDVPGYIQPSLDIVTSTFLDCFGQKQSLSKNSAPHKLLFYKDLEDYRQWVKTFHRAVNNTPSPDEREFAQHMNKLSCTQMQFNQISTLFEVFNVLEKNKEEIIEGLKEDKDTCRLHLSEKLEDVFEIMDSRNP